MEPEAIVLINWFGYMLLNILSERGASACRIEQKFDHRQRICLDRHGQQWVMAMDNPAYSGHIMSMFP